MLIRTVACASTALAVLGLSPSAGAQESAAPTAPAAQDDATVAGRFAAVKADHAQAMKAFETAYEAAKTDAERQQVLRNLLPKPEAFVNRMLSIATAAPKDPAAAECLIWALQNGRDEAQATTILQALQQDHLGSPRLGSACEVLRYGAGKDDEGFLRAVLTKSPHQHVQAQACYTLGLRLADAAAQARTIQADAEAQRSKQLADYHGPEWLAHMRKIDPEALQKEGEALLERVVGEFGAVATPRGPLGERARGDLFEMRNLAVGKPAPEIVGKDLDGVEFKLSDYRGKVVFLDFWGFW
jgi:hypothetical protein